MPFREFLDEMEDLGKLLHLAVSGIARETAMPKALEALQSVNQQDDEAYKTRLREANERAQFAQREIDRDFPKLHGLAAISIWSSLESVFENFVAALLANRSDALQVDTVMKVKISISDYESMTREERFLYLVQQIEREHRLPFREGVSKFEDLLSIFGFGGAVDDEVRRDLFELAQVRNVLSHRSGIADRQFCSRCPWLGLKAGDRIAISHDGFRRYHKAAAAYVSTVILRFHSILGEAGELVPGTEQALPPTPSLS